MENLNFRWRLIKEIETTSEFYEIWDFIEWYYYFSRRKMCWIIVAELPTECWWVWSWLVQIHAEVDYKTVWQYSWFIDSNWTKIYEDDVVPLAWYWNLKVEYPFLELYELDNTQEDIWKIIGNIFENPELLNNS